MTHVVDPVLRHVAQPLVDAVGVDPRMAARQAAAAFIACGIGVAAVRMGTLGAGTLGQGALTVVGAVMIGGWMRACADNAMLCRTMPSSLLHLVVRWGLLLSAADEIVQIVVLASAPSDRVAGVQFARVGMRTAFDLVGAAALYLALCDRPPPRRRREARRALAT